MADIDIKSEQQVSNAADAAKRRREIRRRNILNNEADRMKKLHGYSEKTGINTVFIFRNSNPTNCKFIICKHTFPTKSKTLY